jgi:Ca2+-binding RTX toxin-like protein
MPAPTLQCHSVIRDIVVSGGVAYFGAEGTGGGCMDGTFAANVSDGSLKWVNHCLGATQAVEVVGGWLYKGSHAHDCQSQTTDPDGFPQVADAQGRHLLVENLNNGNLGPWYPNTSGNPLGPRAMATDGTQLFVAGDFANVNNKPQQGLARFAAGPDTTPPGKPAAPVAVSGGPGQVSVYVQAPLDQDDTDLTVRLYRDGGTTPIGTADVHSLFWRQPIVGFSDPGLAPGSTHTYRVDAIEKFDTNKSVLSNPATVTVASSPVRCHGAAVTIIGTAGADSIVGTAGHDVIAGLGGADTIRGLGGNDIICGGSGRDIVDGGGGSDYISGGSGSDSLIDGDARHSGCSPCPIVGNDYMVGGAGSDVISASAGNDVAYGGRGDDVFGGSSSLVSAHLQRFYGGPGDDRARPWDTGIRVKFVGGSGDDTLRGGRRSDVLSGGAGRDLLRGYGGSDTLLGGPGVDTIRGGRGIDTCRSPRYAPGCER